jgi:hypothetical protein
VTSETDEVYRYLYGHYRQILDMDWKFTSTCMDTTGRSWIWIGSLQVPYGHDMDCILFMILAFIVPEMTIK